MFATTCHWLAREGDAFANLPAHPLTCNATQHGVISIPLMPVHCHRRPRSDRPVARSARDRTRSPHMHRSPVRSRADHPAPYERRRDAEVPRQAQHAAARHATEPVWPELHAPPSGRKVEDFVRPHLDRAPIRTPDFAWEPAHYDRGASHNAYPPAAEYDYRHAQPEYHEPIGREAGYRAPVYREATFSETGYAAAAAAAQGRDVGYRQPSSYDYDEPAYREYTGSRAIDGPHSSYTRGGPGWDAPRFPDPRHDAYPHRYSASDDRWHEREVRQLPVRENPRLPRADREAVALTRGGSYPYSRHDRGHEGMLPAHDDPRHAPRLAHEYAAPSPRSFRDGLHQASRDVREAPRSVSRCAPPSLLIVTSCNVHQPGYVGLLGLLVCLFACLSAVLSFY